MNPALDRKRLSARRATRADLPRLLELLADDVLGETRENIEAKDPVYALAFEEIDRDPNQVLLVGELDGRLIAMLQMTFIPSLSRRGARRANIEDVRVGGSERGKGVGTWLIGEALRLARERGCRLAQLTSDKRRAEAHRFYGRLGFTASHEGFKVPLGESE